jgi:hypothetical protein
MYFSNVLGKPVKFIDVAPEAYKEQMIQSALPMEYVDAVMNLMFILRAGFADRVTNTFEQLMGRKPMSFSDWVRKYQRLLNKTSQFTTLNIFLLHLDTP